MFKKTYKTVFLFVLNISLILAVTSCNSYNTFEKETVSLDMVVSDKPLTVAEIVRIFPDKIDEYIENKTLVDIEAEFYGYDNIMNQEGTIDFIYSELLSEKGEGGYMAIASVKYDTASQKINKLYLEQGPGKAIARGIDVNIESWTVSFESVLSDFCTKHHDEILHTEKPYVAIRTAGNTVDIYLFTENEDAYLIKESDVEMIR